MNIKLFVIYCATNNIWDRLSIIINKLFACMIVESLYYKIKDPKSQTIKEAMCCSYWLK